MAQQTEIQWTDSTWNVVTGCTRVSPGCARCYIERTPPFRMQHRKFEATGAGETTTGVTLHWDRLEKVPRGPKIFTPSLGDLFHDEVPDNFIAATFDVMRRHPDRVFQVLTKRPERAREWFAGWSAAFERFRDSDWPLPNVWLGVSIENARFTWRADVLRQIPAAVRFISAEPLLGSLFQDSPPGQGQADPETLVSGRPASEAGTAGRRAPLNLAGIDWVIVGGESGPRARSTQLPWVYELVHACRSAGVAPFVKQLGASPLQWSGARDVRGYIPYPIRDAKGGDSDEWPPDLRIREFPTTKEAIAA